MQHIVSILEAAGDKPVLSPPALWGQDLQKAIEAIGDKDVVIAPTDLQEDWQQALYEEFLRWRLWLYAPPLSHGGAFLRGPGRRFHEAFGQAVLLFFGRR
jgi:hypothetical protein